MSAPQAPSQRFAGEERILDWEGALNARDTGGLPTADGRRIRQGALVRSDVISRLTPSGRRALIDHGVRTIVDVRTSEEIGRDVDYPFRDTRAESDPEYVNVSFVSDMSDEQAEAARVQRDTAQTLGELNQMDLEIHRAGIAGIAGAVADAQPGGVLIHCYAGKDRTGMSVALLLSVAGVSDEDIADDYALTMLNFDQLIAEWIETIEEADRDRMRALAMPRQEAMLATLDHVQQRYGTAEQYLLGAGVTPEQIAHIKARLVEDETDG